MDITAAGMKYYEQLLDVGDKNIDCDEEYALREAFDWVEQNEDAKDIDEIVRRRKAWLVSKEFELMSGRIVKMESELESFKNALLKLQKEEMVK